MGSIKLALLQTLFLSAYVANATFSSDSFRVIGRQAINLWKLEQQANAASKLSSLVVQDASNPILPENTLPSEFKERYFTQRLDHFSNTSHTFGQRYWVNTRHYHPGVGGPVIVLDGGETSGEDRLPFLDTGIVEILARATNGVGVVLEHRYYGKSIPVSNFSTDSLRWLNNAQSAADSANFMSNVKFDDIDEDLTAPYTPWIYYGGSYAGARAAHMKILYPELVYGAIASSGVTHATLENWEYMETIRKAADPKCSYQLGNAIETIDAILGNRFFATQLKTLFGLKGLKSNEDFVSVLESPLGSWQAKNWNPAVGSTAFDDFCAALNDPPGDELSVNMDLIPFGERERAINLTGGWSIDFTILNYAKYIKKNIVSKCPEGYSAEDCFGTFEDEKFQGTSLQETWRPWLFQVCTEWGYFSTAPPDQSLPRIVSRLLTLGYQSRICHQAYPPGKEFAIPPLPNITVVNSLGDFDIAADRLAIIDGEVDPWRPDTPHSQYASDREDTILRPFKLIPNGVHHYDEFGLRDLNNEPPEIRKIHGEMITFVLEWLKDWSAPGSEEM